MKIMDIGSNMTHVMFKGWYKHFNAHDNDTEIVLERGKSYGISKCLITSSNLYDGDWAY